MKTKILTVFNAFVLPFALGGSAFADLVTPGEQLSDKMPIIVLAFIAIAIPAALIAMFIIKKFKAKKGLPEQ